MHARVPLCICKIPHLTFLRGCGIDAATCRNSVTSTLPPSPPLAPLLFLAQILARANDVFPTLAPSRASSTRVLLLVRSPRPWRSSGDQEDLDPSAHVRCSHHHRARLRSWRAQSSHLVHLSFQGFDSIATSLTRSLDFSFPQALLRACFAVPLSCDTHVFWRLQLMVANSGISYGSVAQAMAKAFFF